MCAWEEPRTIALNESTQVQDQLVNIPFRILQVPDPILFWVDYHSDNTSRSSRRHFLRYYAQTFTHLLTTNIENNSFLSIFLPMAMHDSALLNALIAWSSSHLSLRDKAFHQVAMHNRLAALRDLRLSLQSSPANVETNLAITLVLCSMESIMADNDKWKSSSFQANIKQAHPLACAAAIAAQNILHRDNLLQQVVTLGKRLEALLCREIGPLPLVGDIRGRGLFWAVEFVIDKKAKTSFPLEANISNKVVANALKRGVNILGNLGHTGTYQVNHILVCPPYITTEEELEKIVALVKGAIVETSQSFI
ncbi:hypothetical protein N7467_010068 [Penicillium canescens]|nr:hypothetical protein N7467_010068 [Penicillium canescens]